MKRSSLKLHTHIATHFWGMLFALGCASTDPARSNSPNPGSAEHLAPDSGSGDAAASRVVGYLPTYRSLDPESFDLAALTHLNIAFALPTTTQAGSPLDFEGATSFQIVKLIAAAHQKNVKVLAALGGGGEGGERVASVLASDPDAFVGSTLALLDKYGLDGIDIDIEGDAIQADPFEKLVTGLAARLPTGKLLTAAVAEYKRENYRALDKLSFLNVMSYDQCGSWSPSPCPHSTYSQAEADLEYWSTGYFRTSGGTYDKANVVLGVPFYGHCWKEGCSAIAGDEESNLDTPSDVEPPKEMAVTYQQVQAFWNKLHPGTLEPVPDLLEDDAHSYYVSLNGPQTIQSKAILAKKYGGIMIWELGQDAPGKDSLLSVIKKAQ